MNLSLHNSNLERSKGSNLKRDPKVKDSNPTTQREEYHLTPEHGLVRSSTVVLNGKRLEVTKEGELPNLTPIYRESKTSINIANWSIAFIVIPDFVAVGCK